MSDTGIIAAKIDYILQKNGCEKFVSWQEVINSLAGQEETDIILIRDSLQGLIDRGTVHYDQKRGYALSANLKSIRDRDQWRLDYAGKIMGRQYFDSLTPQEKMDFVTSGGVLE